MAGTDKSYIRKANPTITTKTRVDSTGKMVTYREVDLYEHNHTPGSHVMDEQGICTSNAGMDIGYYQPEQYRKQNSSGEYIHYVEKSAMNSTGQLETYNEFTQSTAGPQGRYHGDTGEPK